MTAYVGHLSECVTWKAIMSCLLEQGHKGTSDFLLYREEAVVKLNLSQCSLSIILKSPFACTFVCIAMVAKNSAPWICFKVLFLNFPGNMTCFNEALMLHMHNHTELSTTG